MITTTLKQAHDAWPALERLARLPLRPRVAYQVAKLTQKAESEAKHFARLHGELVRTHGVKRPTKTVQERERFGDEMYEVALSVAHRQIFAELDETPVQIDAAPFDLDALGADATISPADVIALGPFLSVSESEGGA